MNVGMHGTCVAVHSHFATYGGSEVCLLDVGEGCGPWTLFERMLSVEYIDCSCSYTGLTLEKGSVSLHYGSGLFPLHTRQRTSGPKRYGALCQSSRCMCK